MTPQELCLLDEEELRHKYDRGDFHANCEWLEAQRLLRSFEREHEFLVKCQRAALSAALDSKNAAKTTNRIAIFAAIMSAIATACSIIALLK